MVMGLWLSGITIWVMVNNKTDGLCLQSALQPMPTVTGFSFRNLRISDTLCVQVAYYRLQKLPKNNTKVLLMYITSVACNMNNKNNSCAYKQSKLEFTDSFILDCISYT